MKDLKVAGSKVAGIDVGGTNIEVGLSRRGPPRRTRRGPAHDRLTLVHSLKGSPAAVGVGIPGVVHQGEVVTVTNLPNWDGPVELADTLRGRLGVPVTVGNDANVGLLGEWLNGAAAGCGSVLGLWMGTGTGRRLTRSNRYPPVAEFKAAGWTRKSGPGSPWVVVAGALRQVAVLLWRRL
jgi:glucokinase